MKYYSNSKRDIYYVEFLVIDSTSYYFHDVSGEELIGVGFDKAHQWHNLKEIQFSELPDHFKKFLKSVKFQNAMKDLKGE